jgi:autotransporter-associated beta strand protein
LNGGRIILGPSGFKSGSLDANTSYAINLGGGVIAPSANWTSVLAMTFTGTNGNTTFETTVNNGLSGLLTGPGGLTKAGAGTLALTGNAIHQGGTIVDQGTLVVRGALGGGISNAVVNANGTLIGDGSIADALVINIGGTLSPGPGVARLTVNNTVTLGGTTLMDITKTGTDVTNDVINGTAAMTFDGTLIVTASGDPLAGGDSFKLFNASSFSGAFDTITLPTLTGDLTWDVSQLAVNGTIRVSQPQPTLSILLSGGSISLGWSNGFSGFVLQGQTNAPGQGINLTNWVTIPTTSNGVSFPVDPTAGSIFYRLFKE